MTAIVGVAEPGKGVVLGADSLGSDGWSEAHVKSPKLYRPRPWLAFGFTTSWRFGQILGHKLQLPTAMTKGADPLDWLVSAFVPLAQKVLGEHGWQRKKDERAEGGTAVVAIGDRAFTLQDDYSVIEHASGIETAGSGYLVARVAGELQRELEPALHAADVAATALRYAELHARGVRGPFAFVSTDA